MAQVPTEPPLGERIEWRPAGRPVRTVLRGDHVLLRPVQATHDTEPLYAVSHAPDGDPSIWTYLPDGPYDDTAHLRQTLTWAASTDDRVYFALVPLPGERPQGMASYLNIVPELGTIEIGHIWYGPSLKRTIAATEAIYLLARHAFDELGYRRLEWKCNALNAASRRAAERFGFSFEGIFRKHQVVKGRNRDTAWYAITDDRWPAIRAGFQAWLQPTNFDAAGHQARTLGELIARGATDTGEVTVRTAAERDLERVLSLWEAAGSVPTVTDTLAGMRRLLANERRALLVAERDGELAGTVIAAWDGWRGSFYRLAVAPELRRRGIATALLREGERRLRELGAVRLTAIVADDDPVPASFWQAVGYTRQAHRARFVRSLSR